MKKILILMVAVLSVISMHAQKKSLLDYQEIGLGTYADGKPVLCHFMTTDGELKNYVLTSDMPLLLINDRRGYRLFNTESYEEIADFKLKGQKLAQLTKEGILVYSPGKMFSFRYGQPTFLNFKGEKVWSNNDEWFLADRVNKVAFCSANRKGDQINVYDILTGKLLWHKTLTGNKHYLWAHTYIDKSNKQFYYLMGDSLIRLNVVTGDTLRHAFTAGVKEPLKSRFSFAKERRTLPSSDFTREAIFSTGIGAVLTGTHSNIIFSGDSLFVADAEHLYCLDKKLNTRWMADLPSGCGSKSTIKVFGDQIRMQNYGVAFQDMIVARCGRPFTASFNRSTGQQTSLAMINIKQKVMGGQMVKGRTYWQTDNQFFYNNDGDSILHKIEWKPNTALLPQETHPDYLICDTVGVVRDGMLEYVTTDKKQLVVEVYGQDVNVIKLDGSCEFLPADRVFLADGNNVYSTNNIGDKPNTFIIVDPKTQKIECTFHLRGKVKRDKVGNIYVMTQQGVGIHKKD